MRKWILVLLLLVWFPFGPCLRLRLMHANVGCTLTRCSLRTCCTVSHFKCIQHCKHTWWDVSCPRWMPTPFLTSGSSPSSLGGVRGLARMASSALPTQCPLVFLKVQSPVTGGRNRLNWTLDSCLDLSVSKTKEMVIDFHHGHPHDITTLTVNEALKGSIIQISLVISSHSNSILNTSFQQCLFVLRKLQTSTTYSTSLPALVHASQNNQNNN